MALDYLGALDIDAALGADDFLGRRRRHRSSQAMVQMSPRMRAAGVRAQRVAALAYPDVPGSPARDGAMLPAAWPVFSFALATGTNIVSQTMNIQAPFRGQRLTATVIRNGTSAALTAPVIRSLQIGMRPVITTPDGVPVEVFSQAAFDTNLLLPPTIPGTIYVLNISLTAALTTTDTITVIVGVIGTAIL